MANTTRSTLPQYRLDDMLTAWAKALTRPQRQTYRALLDDAPLMARHLALRWVAAGAVARWAVRIGHGLLALVVGAGPLASVFATGGSQALGAGIILALTATLIVDVAFAVGLALASHGIARVLDGRGSFDDQIYLTGTILPPLSIGIALLRALRIFGMWGVWINVAGVVVAYVYGIAILVPAMQAAHDYRRGQAVLHVALTVLACGAVAALLWIGGQRVGVL